MIKTMLLRLQIWLIRKFKPNVWKETVEALNNAERRRDWIYETTGREADIDELL